METITMNNNKGFTLTELIIVIAIVAILTAVAVPSVISWRSNWKVSGAARQVMASLQDAKLQAVKTNSDFTVNLPVFAGVTLNDPDGINGSTFNFKGLPSSSGSVRVTNGKKTLRVSLTLAGATRIN